MFQDIQSLGRKTGCSKISRGQVGKLDIPRYLEFRLEKWIFQDNQRLGRKTGYSKISKGQAETLDVPRYLEVRQENWIFQDIQRFVQENWMFQDIQKCGRKTGCSKISKSQVGKLDIKRLINVFKALKKYQQFCQLDIPRYLEVRQENWIFQDI